MPKVSSITRVLHIIETVSYSDKPISPLEISQRLDIPKPTIHRLIHQLCDEGFISIDISGGIIPGLRVRQMGFELWQHRDFFEHRQLILEKLVDDIKETCGIGIPDKHHIIYTNKVQTKLPIQIYLPIGAKIPMGCTATGKLYLSQLDKTNRNRKLRSLPLDKFTKNTIVNINELNRELDLIAKNGIGRDNEEFISEMVSVSVPIRDKNNRYMASLYTHAPTIRLSMNDIMDFIPRMEEAAKEIESLIE